MNEKGREYREIPVADCIPTTDNRRKIREDARMLELIGSVKAQGILEPVLVREHPTQHGKFDMRAGARRLYAAIKAGKISIPAIVRKMTDEEAFEITISENANRDDLTVLEEAESVAICLKHGWDIKAIATHIGKSEPWVRRRAQILNLSPTWMKLLQKDGDLGYWPAGSWELIARLPQETQEALYKDRKYSFRDGCTIEDIERHIEDFTRVMSSAKWKLDEDCLGGMRTCAGCPQRACHQPMLFEEVPKPESKNFLAKDRCLNPKCWERKLAAIIERKKNEAIEKYGSVTLVSNLYSTSKGTESEHHFERVKKDDPKAKPCLYIDGPQAGEVHFMKRASWAGGDRPEKTPVELKDALMRKRFEAFKELLEEKQEARGIEKYNLKLADDEDPKLFVLCIASSFGLESHIYGKEQLKKFTMLRELLHNNRSEFDSTIDAILKEEIHEQLDDLLNGFYDSRVESREKYFKFYCEIYGFDYELLWREICEKFPETAKKKESKNIEKKSDRAVAEAAKMVTQAIDKATKEAGHGDPAETMEITIGKKPKKTLAESKKQFQEAMKK